MAKLYFRYGVMGSAKSAELLIKAYLLENNGFKICLLKPSIDTREGTNVIKSRIGILAECIFINKEENILDKLLDHYYDFILVDEALFLTGQQVELLAYYVDNVGGNVFCYGLRTDYQTHLFTGSKRLMELADTIEEIKSVCSCGHKAIINAKFNSKGEIIKEDGNIIDIGGDDKYKSICRKCYFKK